MIITPCKFTCTINKSYHIAGDNVLLFDIIIILGRIKIYFIICGFRLHNLMEIYQESQRDFYCLNNVLQTCMQGLTVDFHVATS